MKEIRIGLLGLGTVGSGTALILQNNRQLIERRLGLSLRITRVAAREFNHSDELDTQAMQLGHDPMALTTDPDIDVVVELMGGTGLAHDCVASALQHGKPVITANKALIATHGNSLRALAEQHAVVLAYEAAVAGGIPVIKAVREGLAGNRIDALAGIINGTGNYILTAMRDAGTDFATVLKDAQDKGYAEADPTYDVEGIDAAHKLAILASISFGMPLALDKVYTEGISRIEPCDLNYARQLGYQVKHLGIARCDHGQVQMRVHPALIADTHLLAQVDGVMNAVWVHGDAVGDTLYYGAGAGTMPTGSAVVADIMDVARSLTVAPAQRVPTLAFQHTALAPLPVMAMREIRTAAYLRCSLPEHDDAATILVKALERAGVRLRVRLQGVAENSLVGLTEVCCDADLDVAIDTVTQAGLVASGVQRIRLEDLS